MNRLSFLKTIGVGIAAAVITPKLLIAQPEKVVEKAKVLSPFHPYDDEIKSLFYGHYEEDMPRYTVENLCLNDTCIDKDLRVWLCTAMGFGMIELTALLAEPEPNFIEIKRNNFDDYFVIMGNYFKNTDV